MTADELPPKPKDVINGNENLICLKLENNSINPLITAELVVKMWELRDGMYNARETAMAERLKLIKEKTFKDHQGVWTRKQLDKLIEELTRGK